MKITKNLAAIHELLMFITDNPDEFDMFSWVHIRRCKVDPDVDYELGACGTVGCLAGHAVGSVADVKLTVVTGDRFPDYITRIDGLTAGEWFQREFEENRDFYREYYRTAGVDASNVNGGYVNWPEAGARVLGLTYPEANALFYTSNTDAPAILRYLEKVATDESYRRKLESERSE